ncbi:hypothetical protein H4R19_006687, partial [Coemansia spiralis]
DGAARGSSLLHPVPLADACRVDGAGAARHVWRRAGRSCADAAKGRCVCSVRRRGAAVRPQGRGPVPRDEGAEAARPGPDRAGHEPWAQRLGGEEQGGSRDMPRLPV